MEKGKIYPGEPLPYLERIEVRWPGGPHDFVLEFHFAEKVPPPSERFKGWVVLHGVIVSPMQYWGGLFCHQVDDHYEMVPKID